VRERLSETEAKPRLAVFSVPAPYIDDIATAYSVKRADLERSATQRVVGLPSVAELRWRVDVTISTTTMSRVFRPSVTMQMRLTDGKIHTFEVPIAEFQSLRYGVARALKDMNDLESNPVLQRVAGLS
jgi:hypothetical protein